MPNFLQFYIFNKIPQTKGFLRVEFLPEGPSIALLGWNRIIFTRLLSRLTSEDGLPQSTFNKTALARCHSCAIHDPENQTEVRKTQKK